jgi:hypothetical protein
MVSFLYIAIITASWRAGCTETLFWFILNGTFMLLWAIGTISYPQELLLVIGALNAGRATMLLIMGRGTVEKEEPAEEEAEMSVEGITTPELSTGLAEEEDSGDSISHEHKAIQIAARYAFKAGYVIEDLSDKKIGYTLKITRQDLVHYILVKIKIEADGVIYLTETEYERAREYSNNYYLFALFGGVDPWVEEIHIVKNPAERLKWILDRTVNQFGIDCDDIRTVSKEFF